ncbi:TetR/AcrR family transcriptional regulator [Mycolicibacterium mucogenicum]|jgi:AcrR family transcriptional regulator|uniref:TetR/AcrR family transcriptional regulator n=1 Tax=Mycolicibacterium mucogenicum TaxID=56689 RepID=UPI002269E14F|nr:TetR/AcrR family transcriptional regulator [Mycolicibacterium mucogenicum]
MDDRADSSAAAVGKARIRMADRQRAQRAELVRDEVIDAALAEFAERGYHQTSISHIAKRLGSGHSMFYRYFENKRDIVDHAVRQVNDRLTAAIDDATPSLVTSIEEFGQYLSSIGMAYTEVLAEEPRLLQLIVVQAAGVDQEMSQRFYRMYDGGAAVLGAALRDGIARGFIRPDLDIDATVESIVAIPFGIALRYGHKPDRDVLIAQTNAISALVCRGVTAPLREPVATR